MDTKKQEFIELFKRTGWSQAEAARRLELTRAGVNGIVTGSAVPSQSTLTLFRLLVEMQNNSGPLPHADGDWKDRAIRAERELREIKSTLHKLSAAGELAEMAGESIDLHGKEKPSSNHERKSREGKKDTSLEEQREQKKKMLEELDQLGLRGKPSPARDQSKSSSGTGTGQ